MTYDFDDPTKFEDEYDATAVKRGLQPKKEHAVDRSNSKMSAKSARSYISNLSEINRQNLSTFHTNKIVFLGFNGIVRVYFFNRAIVSLGRYCLGIFPCCHSCQQIGHCQNDCAFA